MTNSYQKEIPKARINITLDVETGGALRKKELPLKLLALGNFSEGKTEGSVAKRERINIHKNNFDQVLSDLSPSLKLNVPNTLKKDSSELNVELNFTQFKDFHPDEMLSQIPQLKKLLSMRNLLKDLKSNLIDNHAFRKELEKLAQDKNALSRLREELKIQAPLDSEEG
jgi:type VI secretion system protein ImpB